MRFDISLTATFLFLVTGCFDLDFDFSGCGSDEACPAGQICSATLLSNVCKDAQICSGDSDCEAWRECRVRGSGFLSGGISRTRTTCEARLCESDKQCPERYVCEETCAARETCESDAQCDDDHVCRLRFDIDNADDARRTCEQPLCHADNECPTNWLCLGSSSDARVCEPGGCASHDDCRRRVAGDIVKQCQLRDTLHPGVSQKSCEVPSCTSDAECPLDSLCMAEYACLWTDSTCASDDDCTSPLVCGAPSWRSSYDPETERGVCQRAGD